MARQRQLKPEFFRKRLIGKLGPVAALVYEALWCWADDGGVCRAEPQVLKGDPFLWWPDVTVEDITEALARLSGAGRVKLYAVGEDLYAEIPNLAEHSPISHPSKFRYPRGGERVTDLRAWLSGQLTPDGLRRDAGESPDTLTPRIAVSRLPDASSHSSPAARARADDAVVTELRSGIPEADHDALDGILRAAQDPTAVAATIRGMGPGGIEAKYSWATIGQALHDLRGASDPRFCARRFRKFCEKLVEDQRTPASAERRGRPETDVDQTPKLRRISA